MFKSVNGRGSILPITSIGLLALVLIVGLCINVSHFLLIGSELQNAADAAAIAGASALNTKAGGIVEATNRATTIMNDYGFRGDQTVIPRENVRFAANLIDFQNGGSGLSETEALATAKTIKFVKVTIPPERARVLFASALLGRKSIDISKKAIAGLSVNLNRICSIIPISVLQDDTVYPPAPLHPNPDCPDKTKFTPGCTYTIRLGGGNSVAPGTYLPLAILDDRGASDLRQGLAKGVDVCYTKGMPVAVEPGVQSGPVSAGFNTRFGDYKGNTLGPEDAPPDTNVQENITYEQYRSGYPSAAPKYTGVRGRRIVVIPIVNQREYSGGRDPTVVIDSFGAFFLQKKIGNGGGNDDITAEYIGDPVTLGDGSYDPNGSVGFFGLTVPVIYQ